MHAEDGAVGHQFASFPVETDIEMPGGLVCRDEALPFMNCRTRMAVAPGGAAANLHAAASHRRSRGKYRVRGRSIAECGRGNFPPPLVWVSARPATFVTGALEAVIGRSARPAWRPVVPGTDRPRACRSAVLVAAT
jgi:hypothetical protein